MLISVSLKQFFKKLWGIEEGKKPGFWWLKSADDIIFPPSLLKGFFINGCLLSLYGKATRIQKKRIRVEGVLVETKGW